MKVVTVRNGFIIVTLLALSGAISVVGSHGWLGMMQPRQRHLKKRRRRAMILM
jgi:hypothetical protein